MAKLDREQRLVNSISRRKLNTRKTDEIDYELEQDESLDTSNDLIEQVMELYGKEYDFSVLTNEGLKDFLNYALESYNKNDLSLLKEENLPLDLKIKLNSLPVLKIEQNDTKQINQKSKTTKKENDYAWNKNFALPDSKFNSQNIIIEADVNMCADSTKYFIETLLASYIHMAETNNLKVRDIETSDKKYSLLIEGENAFEMFKFEKGLHYIKEKEYNSNVFISTMPQMQEEDYEIKINPNDLKIDTYRSGGAGGQHVNKTSSAVRITHIPTGTVVTCQNERSQLMNKNMAMKLLSAKLNEIVREEKENKEIEYKLNSLDTTKIRTYDLNNNTLTDHRIGYKTGIEQGMDKFDFSKVIDKLSKAEKQLESINKDNISL